MQDHPSHAKAHKRSWLDDELRLKKAILPCFGPLRLAARYPHGRRRCRRSAQGKMRWS
jgi:hypothetical protein